MNNQLDKPKNTGWSFSKTRRLTLTGLLFACALVLSLVESALPPVFAAVPGIRLGLSNVAVMYAIFFMGAPPALAIAVLKSLFVAMTRGAVAGFISFSGGMASVLAMLALALISRRKASFFILSLTGAVVHNIGQLAAVSLIYTTIYSWAYLPVLLIAGMVAGALTAVVLRVSLPALQRLGLDKI